MKSPDEASVFFAMSFSVSSASQSIADVVLPLEKEKRRMSVSDADTSPGRTRDFEARGVKTEQSSGRGRGDRLDAGVRVVIFCS